MSYTERKATTMTERERNLMYETIEYCRKLMNAYQGWKDADDYMFSRLNFTKGDLQYIYNGHNEFVYCRSAIEGRMPAGLTYAELLPFARHKSLYYTCSADDGTYTGDEGTAYVHPVGLPNIVLLTEADCPQLINIVGESVYLFETPATGVNPAEIVVSLADRTPLYSTTEAG